MAGEYIVKWTDDQNGTNPLKPRFVVQPNTLNGPGHADSDTALELPGRFTPDYGEALSKSFVWLMENFSSPNEPSPATSGMLWYDSANEVLKVRNTNNDDWIEVGSGGAVGEFPPAYQQQAIQLSTSNVHPNNPSIYFATSPDSPITELKYGTSFYFTVDQTIEDLQATSLLIQLDGLGSTMAGPDDTYLMTPTPNFTPGESVYKTNRTYFATYRGEGVFHAFDPQYVMYAAYSMRNPYQTFRVSTEQVDGNQWEDIVNSVDVRDAGVNLSLEADYVIQDGGEYIDLYVGEIIINGSAGDKSRTLTLPNLSTVSPSNAFSNHVARSENLIFRNMTLINPAVNTEADVAFSSSTTVFNNCEIKVEAGGAPFIPVGSSQLTLTNRSVVSGTNGPVFFVGNVYANSIYAIYLENGSILDASAIDFTNANFNTNGFVHIYVDSTSQLTGDRSSFPVEVVVYEGGSESVGSGDSDPYHKHIQFDIANDNWDDIAAEANAFPYDVTITMVDPNDDGWYLFPEGGANITGSRAVTLRFDRNKYFYIEWDGTGCQFRCSRFILNIADVYVYDTRTEPVVVFDRNEISNDWKPELIFRDCYMFAEGPFCSISYFEDGNFVIPYVMRLEGTDTYVEGWGDGAVMQMDPTAASRQRVDVYPEPHTYLGYRGVYANGSAGSFDIYHVEGFVYEPGEVPTNVSISNDSAIVRVPEESLAYRGQFALARTQMFGDIYEYPAVYDNAKWNFFNMVSEPRTVGLSDYTLNYVDVGKYLRCTNSGATTITIPADSYREFIIGAEIHIRAVTNGTVTIAGEAGVTINTPASGGLVLAEAGAAATIKKVAADEWDIMGQVSA